MMAQYADEIGVKPVEFKELLYLADEERYEEATKVPEGAQHLLDLWHPGARGLPGQGQTAARMVHPP